MRSSNTGFQPVSNYCGMCDCESHQLLDCGRCGMASYCSKACQMAAYPEHKVWCKMTAANFPKDKVKGERRVLFSRRFGGAYSLLMKQGYQNHESRRGLIHAKFSHPLADYCGRRRTQDKRSIVLTWIPEGEELLTLQQEALGSSQTKRDAEGQGWLEQSLDNTDILINHMRQVHEDEDLPYRFCIVAVQEPGVKFLRTHILYTYLSWVHWAHGAYEDLKDDCRWGTSLEKTVTLDWDYRPSSSDDLGDSLQWLLSNSITASFYRKCSLAYQDKERRKQQSPWPGGVLTPPLALGLNLSTSSIHSEEPYTLTVSY